MIPNLRCVNRMKHNFGLDALVAIISMLAGGMLAGCAIGPDYSRPDLAVPNTFRGAAQMADSASAPTPDLLWRSVYTDADLAALITVALDQSFDIRTAVARVEEARALAGVGRLRQLPQIAAQVGESRNRAAGTESNSYVGSVDISYELDLWQRLSQSSEAAKADLLANENTARSVRVTVVSDVATAFYTLKSLEDQLAVTRRTVLTREKYLDLSRAQARRGAISGLELSRAEANVASARSAIPDVERQTAQVENQLKVLLGGTYDFKRTEQTRGPLPTLPEVPAGMPSTLLTRRPDLIAAEANVMAATARLRSTRASLFPTISLTGSLGSQSLELSKLFTGPAGVWSIGLGLLQPIINADKNIYAVDAAKAREQQVAISYQKAVEQAFREVSDALIARTKALETQMALETQVMHQQNVKRRVERRYELGYTSFFEVNDADRDLFNAELQLVQAYRNSSLATVQVYKAVGGGWQ
jgi:outer membrane protein, multidrug efflux system